MSPRLQRQIAAQEEAEAREAAKLERERAYRAEQFQERAQQSAIAAALEAGEEFHPRMLHGERLGHQPHEFIAAASARMDVEDQRFEASELAEFREWKRRRGEATQGDTAAPTQRQLDADKLMQERAAKYRARQNDRLWTLELAREQSAAQTRAALR
jgi:hypothetical protein